MLLKCVENRIIKISVSSDIIFATNTMGILIYSRLGKKEAFVSEKILNT